MANISLLPGYGGMYTSALVGSTDTYPQSQGTDDTIDLSNCDSFALQVASTDTAVGSIRVVESFNNVSYIAIASSISVATDAIGLFPESNGPYGKIKIDLTSLVSGSIRVHIVGFKRY